jgi:hypothetical protein
MDRPHPKLRSDLAIVADIVFGLAGWGLARQMDHLAEDLPRYRVNILAKMADVRRGQGRIGREAAGDNRRHQTDLDIGREGT